MHLYLCHNLSVHLCFKSLCRFFPILSLCIPLCHALFLSVSLYTTGQIVSPSSHSGEGTSESGYHRSGTAGRGLGETEPLHMNPVLAIVHNLDEP